MPINWVEILLGALTSVVFIAGALAGLAFAGQSIIDRWFSRNLEKYKADLQAANATELEKLRADLRLAGYEYEIRLAELHKQQAKVIVEFYKLLVAANERIKWMGSVLVSDEEASLSPEEITPKRINDASTNIIALDNVVWCQKIVYFLNYPICWFSVLFSDLMVLPQVSCKLVSSTGNIIYNP